MKKLMLLGGLRYLIPVIEEAHKLDIYVILSHTVDPEPISRYFPWLTGKIKFNK